MERLELYKKAIVTCVERVKAYRTELRNLEAMEVSINLKWAHGLISEQSVSDRETMKAMLGDVERKKKLTREAIKQQKLSLLDCFAECLIESDGYNGVCHC